MKIHFICRGNVYRSRMAEAYAKSLLHKDVAVRIYSSGIQAGLALNGKVDPAAVEALKEDGINNYLSPSWQQTTQELLDNSDLNVFMTNSVYSDAKNDYEIDDSKAIIWNIPDIDGVYSLIKQQVEKFFKEHLIK